jgi:hypothetical protein
VLARFAGDRFHSLVASRLGLLSPAVYRITSLGSDVRSSRGGWHTGSGRGSAPSRLTYRVTPLMRRSATSARSAIHVAQDESSGPTSKVSLLSATDTLPYQPGARSREASGPQMCTHQAAAPTQLGLGMLDPTDDSATSFTVGIVAATHLSTAAQERGRENGVVSRGERSPRHGKGGGTTPPRRNQQWPRTTRTT